MRLSKNIIILILIVILMLIAAVFSYAKGYMKYTYWTDPPMMSLCEDIIKDNIASPASYQRIEFFEATKKLDRKAYIENVYKLDKNRLTRSDNMRRFDASGSNATLYSIVITYDALNTYGVPLRKTNICQTTFIGNNKSFNKLNVKVDGVGYFDF